MEQTHQRRLLAGLVVATLVLLGADLAGSGVAEAVRSAGGTVIGPVQRALSGAPRDEIAALEAQNVLLRATVAEQQRRLAEQERLGRAARRRRRPPATVSSPPGSSRATSARSGGRSLTLDVGARDGVTVDSTVVTAEGLAGRVVAVVAVDERRAGARQHRLGHRRAGRPRGHPRDRELALARPIASRGRAAR